MNRRARPDRATERGGATGAGSPPERSATADRRGRRFGDAFPTIARLRRHHAPDLLRDDLLAGLALTAVLVPVGMGYAEAAGLPAIAGLYASVGALVAYFLVGPSRILVFGPDSSLIPLIAATVVPLAEGDPGRAIALAATLSLLSGIVCLAAAASRLGFLTDLLSRPIRIGYMNGIAIVILAGQVPTLLGFAVDARDVTGEIAGLVRGIADGYVVPVAAALGLVGLATNLILRRVAPRLPGVLIAVAGSAAAVLVLGPGVEVSVVGEVPRGFPVLGLPAVTWADVVALFPTAVAIALISFADTSVISHAFAARGNERVDPDRELAALGATQIAAGLVGGFTPSGSGTRTPVAEQAGARTQLAGLVGALAIVLVLVLVPGLLAPVPTAALAAVVVAAALSLVDVDGLRRLLQVRPSELGLALVAFLSVVVFGALPGIGVAVALSLLNFIRRAWRPYDAVLGRVANYKGYHDLERHPEGRVVPGLVLYRWDAPLFFANAQLFGERALDVLRAAPTPTRRLVVAAEPITDIDTTAAEVLEALLGELDRTGVELQFAELKGRVKDRLKVYGLYDRLGGDGAFHPTVGSAVRRYLADHPDVEWRDWEDDPLPP